MEKQTFTLIKPIRSFVLRTGRMTKGQKRAMDELFPRWGIDYQSSSLLMDDVFERSAPIVLEIGFGMGQSLVEQASKNPDKNFLGIEVHQPGVGACLLMIEESGIDNLKVIQHDAVEVLNNMIPDESLQGMQVFFPDPWHKKKHHKRRLIQTDFLEMCCQKLMKQGWIHCATDWQDYAEHMLRVFKKNQQLKNRSLDNTYVERPASRPLTKFEKRGERLGHSVWDLIFDKMS